MKKILYLIVGVFSISFGYSQEKTNLHQLYIEFGGAGLATSLNYEKQFLSKPNNIFSAKVGIGYLPLFVNGKASVGTYCLILGANYIKGYKNHHAVFGISNSLASSFASGLNKEFNSLTYSYLLVPSIGYRYQVFEKNKIFAGIGYSPIISFSGFSVENKLLQYKNHFYLSLGITL